MCDIIWKKGDLIPTLPLYPSSQSYILEPKVIYFPPSLHIPEMNLHTANLCLTFPLKFFLMSMHCRPEDSNIVEEKKNEFFGKTKPMSWRAENEMRNYPKK